MIGSLRHARDAISARRRHLALAAAALTLVPLGAVALGNEIHQVVQADRKFRATAITIARGDVLRFINDDPYVHQIYVDSPAFEYESAMQPPKDVIAVQFTAAGIYQVMCHIHPTMRLTVTVK